MKTVTRAGARISVLACAMAVLAACESSGVTGMTTASQDKVHAIRVSSVAVKLETPKPNPLLEAALKSELEKAMPLCAKGSVDHRLEVGITNFQDQDVAKAILIGDEIELQGKARFVDAASEELTGEYFVENSFFWGGFVGAAMMSDAEQQLSRDFAKTLCKEVFGVELK